MIMRAGMTFTAYQSGIKALGERSSQGRAQTAILYPKKQFIG
jgi:hypothetical protein